MFKRREKPPVGVRLREFVAPRRGWSRVFEYYRHRMQRLPDSPTRIALGFACGVFTSFTPLFGFHFVFAAIFAWIIRGNVLASAIGTFIGNPVTFPFIVALNLELGSWIMGSPIPADFVDMGMQEMIIYGVKHVHQLVIPYFVGGLGPGIVSAVASYMVIKPLVVTYQRRRRQKLMARAKARIEAEAQGMTDLSNK
ncbi:MAG: DUF2062 domain-containing protein [Pseudomonadota bacterium]